MSDIVALLKSPNPAERKQGIKLLVKSNHPDALRYLAAIYKKDTDASVREMALKGGQYLKEQAAAEEATAQEEADYGYQEDSYDYDETSYADEEEVYVDEARFQAADRKSTGKTSSKSKKKLKNDEKLKHEEDGEKAVSWGDAFLDLALYGLFTGQLPS